MKQQTGEGMTQAAVTTESPTTVSQILGALTPDTPRAPAPEKEAVAEERVSPKLQALIKREKIALERERAANEREASVAARTKEFEARESKIREFESLKQTKPLEALRLLGLDYQELTQAALNDGSVTPDVQVKKLEEKFNSYISDQERALLQEKEAAQKQEEQKQAEVLEKFKGEITSYLSSNSDRYELIAFEGSQDLVFDVIDEHYNRTKDPETGAGKVMTIAEAADKVEQHLEQKYDKARSLKKVNALLSRKTEQTSAKPQSPQQQRQTPKTLTNTLSATPSRPTAKVLTDEQRIAKAIAFAKGLRP